MSDQDEPEAIEQAELSPKDSLSKGLGKHWSSLVRRGGSVVDRLTDSVKDVGRASLLKQALEARERGNLAAAFWLLDEEYRGAPEEPDVATSFWDVAVAYERPLDAVPAVTWLIRRHSAGGGVELAVQYWSELIGLVPDALVEPTVLIRLIPALQQKLEEEDDEQVKELRHYVLLKAVGAIVDPRNAGLSSGVAIHVAELVREIDPESALAAARIALDSEDLHETKRDRLRDLIAELDPDAPPRPEIDKDEQHPARKHPLREHAPPRPGLSEEEIAAMQAKLPSVVRPLPSATPPPETPESSTDLPLDADDDLAELELDANMESYPEIETDPNDVSHPHIDSNFEVAVEADVEDDEIDAVEVDVESSHEAADPEENVVVVEVADPPAPIEPSADDARFPDLKTMEGSLRALDEDALSVTVAGGRTARVEYEMIDAIAVAELPGNGQEDFLVVDLLLNWKAKGDGPLRAIRLRAEGFEARVLSDGADASGMELRDAVAEILDKSQASPLPDPDSVLGLAVQRFDSLEAYERDLLQVGH